MKNFLKKFYNKNIKKYNTKELKEVKLPAFEYTPPPYRAIPKEDVLKLREQYVNPGIFKYYKKPLMITDAKMQYMFDETGRRYLDFLGGKIKN
jgi:alanine-glyoxylate transaminase/(R)-3-amino-2-methylpropionate-pyruvate transaminase